MEKLSFAKIINYIYLSVLIILFTIFLSSSLTAADLTPSENEIKFRLDQPEELLSQTIKIRTINPENNNLRSNNIYLENFTLKNSRGKEIPARYIKVETPYLKETLEKSYRFLLMKRDQQKSWFKIGLSRKTAFLEPGSYQGSINIDGLDWQINIELLIEPFVNLSLSEKEVEFEIDNAAESDFFTAPDLYQLNVEYNHDNWEILANLENEFVSESGNTITAENLFYRLEDLNQKKYYQKSEKDNFENMKENEAVPIINGSDYQKGLTGIRFAVSLTGPGASVQPAGLYSGNIVFTLRTFNNSL